MTNGPCRDKNQSKGPMVMVLGDVHGEFDRMVLEYYRKSIARPDLVFQVGDLETVRDEGDADELSGPTEYNQVRDFPGYWDGSSRYAPIPIETYFIGGNHEVWSLLYEHEPDRGRDNEIAENLFYLGRVGVTDIDGLTVAFLSGVYGESSFDESSEERLRWAQGMGWQKSKRTAHFRFDEVMRLMEDGQKDVDLLLTHSWPSTSFLNPDGVPEENVEYGVDPIGHIVEVLEPVIHVAGHCHSAQPPVPYRDADTIFVGLNRLNYNSWDACMIEFGDRENPTVTEDAREEFPVDATGQTQTGGTFS